MDKVCKKAKNSCGGENMKEKQEINNEKDVSESEVALCEDCESEFYRPFWSDLFWDRPLRREFGNLQNLMRTDIEETNNGYEFKVEVPGLARKDINIGFESGYLTIAVNKAGAIQSQNKYLRRERVVNGCSRSFYVGEIDQTQINATLQDGILTIFVPKEVKSQRHQIEIK